MAALELTEAQSQILTNLETPTKSAYADGVNLPGGTPSTLKGFSGYNKLTEEQKNTTMDGVKAGFAPLVKVLTESLGGAPTYIPVTFTGGFASWGDSNYSHGAIKLYKDITGHVHLHGLMRSPTAGATAGVYAFQLPVGYRPGSGRIYPCVSNDALVGVQINSDGQLWLRATVPNNMWVSLEIQFYAEG